jgi:hypothetical protein
MVQEQPVHNPKFKIILDTNAPVGLHCLLYKGGYERQDLILNDSVAVILKFRLNLYSLSLRMQRP